MKSGIGDSSVSKLSLDNMKPGIGDSSVSKLSLDNMKPGIGDSSVSKLSLDNMKPGIGDSSVSKLSLDNMKPGIGDSSVSKLSLDNMKPSIGDSWVSKLSLDNMKPGIGDSWVSKLSLDNMKPDGIRPLFEKCPDGYFGFKCNFICRCPEDQPCDKMSGICLRGCKDGFWGPGCQLANSCYYNGQKRYYMGTLSYSKTMYTCQRWEAKIPHGHSYKEIDFPDGVYPRNYCRTTSDSDKPWCYTTTGKLRWEYCSISGCDCPHGRFGHNCRNECHCQDSSKHCDSIMGRCSSGCATGWSGVDCQTSEPCPPNRYGWECGQVCQCENPDDCDRFLGPTEKCTCKKGFFNPPYCEPVTAPRIVFFGNEKVNPGQTAFFNCTVAAFPTPYENDITLLGPVQKQISLISSNTLDKYLYTRINIFQVKYVMNGGRYTCAVQTVAGSSQMTVVANVYELPRLNTPPTVISHDQDASKITLEWHRWDPSQGDTGHGPIIWYYVYIRHERESNFTMAGQLYHALCKKTCTFTISELEPNSKYSICISTRREGDKGEGPHGPVIHVRTNCTEPLLPAVISEITSELQYNASYPKTRVLIKWKDPVLSSINCNRIQKYILFVSPEASRVEGRVSDVAPLELPGDTTQISVSNLEPFTQYCAVLVFENNGRLRSPESRRECIVTSQTTPGPPENFRILSRSSSKVALSWKTPLLSFGVVTKFHILYWEGEDDSPKGVEMKLEGQEQIEFLLSGLQANTYYRVQVRGVNSAGAGEPSQTLSFTTEEGLPGPVSHLTNISRTSTSIVLQWQQPQQQNGELLNFLVHCEMNHTFSNGVPTLQPHKTTTVPASVLELNVRNLVPASLYKCSVRATTKAGTGQPVLVNIWTHPEALSPPISPEITKVTENTVTLRLHESSDNTVSYYRIIVEKVNSGQEQNRNKRHIPKYISEISQDFQTALRDGKSTYVTAQLLPHQLRGNFVVGDNRTYHGYFNGPLQQDQKYTIWLGAYSNIDGTRQHAFVKADRPVVARSMTAVDAASSVPVIVGVIVVFILLIAILAVLLLFWRRRHIAEEREKAEIPSFGPTIVPEPETSTPPTPIGRTMFHFAENIEVEPLIENASTEILLDTEPVYSNTSEVIAPIKVEDLWDYIRTAKLNDLEGLKKEYKLLPAGITSTCEVARKNENKLKNRYGNIIAYDHTRVILDVEGYDQSDDYINANYIDGYNKHRAYIAAQGPSKPTVNDIWRMVWKENSKTIIMLTNPTESGKRKCEQYWPEDGCEQYGNISAQLLDVDVLPDFTVRTFLISKGGQSKYVKQFHYTTWPDHGVPRFGHSLLLFRQKIRAYDSLDNGALVIHCSAGVGRTGTYISVDTQLEKAKSEGIIDVYNFVQLMRTQRVNMVQTLEQYIFVYDCLLEALICGDTTISSHAFPEVYTDLCLFDNDISKTKLEEQFEILKLLSTTIERDESTTALRPENIFKNRCKTIIPANRCRPYLMTACEGSNDYINAVFLNSYCRKDRLLVTQMPLPNTVIDFWRLVYDHKSYCIVMLNEVEKNDETCEQYWTEEPGGIMYGPFQVETTSVIKSNPIVTVRDFTLTNTEMPEISVRQIRQFHFHRWQEGSATPSSQRALLELVHMTDAWQQTHDGPITVHCMNGASRSGLFCAVLTVLERVKKEKEVDVFQAVKQLRLNRTQLIDNMEQYQFCHEVVMEYLSNPDATTLLS